MSLAVGPPRGAPWWMFVVAASFVAAFALNPYLWLYGPDDIGGADFRFRGGVTEIRALEPGSEMDRVGLRAGDRVVAIDGQRMAKGQDWSAVKANMVVGQPLRWEVLRGGERLILDVVPRPIRRDTFYSRAALLYNIGICSCYLLIAIFIAFRRPHDPVARVGAWFLATASIAFGFNFGWAATWRSLPLAAQALLWIPQVSRFVLEGIFVSFAAIFPRRLFRSPSVWALIWLPVLATLPWRVAAIHDVVHRPHDVTSSPSWIFQVATTRAVVYLLLGAGLLALSYRRLSDVNDRRRLRVLVAGTLVTLGAAIVMVAFHHAGHVSGAGVVVLTACLPLFVACPAAFAYAILRHRVFDIQVIVRKGLQYGLARGSVLALVPALGLVLLADLTVHSREPLSDILVRRAWIYGALAAVGFLLYAKREDWLRELDRRFFRDRYDAQRVLRDVVGEVRASGSFAAAAPRVAARIEGALHPEFAAVMVREPGQPSFLSFACAPAGVEPPPIPADSKLMALVRVLGRPLEVLPSASGWLSRGLPEEDTDFVRRAGIDLLVPVAASGAGREAILVLGLKRSEEPYSRDDQELLEAIAASLALLFEDRSGAPEAAAPAFQECPQCGACYESAAARCDVEQAALTPVRLPRVLGGRYRLDRRLGRGGMGAVYAATDASLGRPVAVKVMRDELAGSAAAAERFRREARAAASFTHPNVVTVHDFDVEAGVHAFLVMELLEGVTLREELRRRRRFDATAAVEVLRAVSSAVHAAHARRLVHRDLKPENVFLAAAPGPSTGAVKVLDFGIAKSLLAEDASESRATVTKTGPGVLLGTPAYMSPEQLLGGVVTPGWDVWALAVIAYEMLTGALPFGSSTSDDWADAIVTGRFAPVAAHVPDAPPRLQEFFEAGFSTRASDRPASAPDFLARLEAAVS